MTLRLSSLAISLCFALLVGACALDQNSPDAVRQPGGAAAAVAQAAPVGDEDGIPLFDEPLEARFDACPVEVETEFEGCTTLMAFHQNATIRSCYCAGNVTPFPPGTRLPIPNGRRNVVAIGSAGFIKFDNAGQGGDPCETRTVNGKKTTVCWGE